MQVVDEDGFRVLSFNGSTETRMSLTNPLQGHFEYTEYFQMPWLWNTNLSRVLMMGLGGGSTQRAYASYYPDVTFHTVEIDPMVRRVARLYFGFKEGPKQQVHVQDGRLYLRRSEEKFDVIMMDAYVKNRYGSFIPYHLVTKEFFELVRDHLTDQGVVAYNVIGSVSGYRADILGAVYKTLHEVFPQVYLFPARRSHNVVLLATRSAQKVDGTMLNSRARKLAQQGVKLSPNFRTRISSFSAVAPFTSTRSPVLTDDYAPVDGLLDGVRK